MSLKKKHFNLCWQNVSQSAETNINFGTRKLKATRTKHSIDAFLLDFTFNKHKSRLIMRECASSTTQKKRVHWNYIRYTIYSAIRISFCRQRRVLFTGILRTHACSVMNAKTKIRKMLRTRHGHKHKRTLCVFNYTRSEFFPFSARYRKSDNNDDNNITRTQERQWDLCIEKS